MDRWRALCCGCACATGTKEARTQSVAEEDFLLPGGEWDPSLSQASSRSSRSSSRAKNSVRSRIERAESGATGTGDYVPPPVPAVKTLPTFDEFRLLKTVGKGAFGKVITCMPHPLFNFVSFWSLVSFSFTTVNPYWYFLGEAFLTVWLSYIVRAVLQP